MHCILSDAYRQVLVMELFAKFRDSSYIHVPFPYRERFDFLREKYTEIVSQGKTPEVIRQLFSDKELYEIKRFASLPG